MPFIAGAVSVTFGTLTLITGDAMWVQIKVTLFNALVAAVLWVGLRTGHNFFRFVFGKTFHYTEEGWHKLTRNVALFFLGTAVINEVVRLGFNDFEMFALDRIFTGIDIWILFKIFIIMPVTAAFFWWQVAADAEVSPSRPPQRPGTGAATTQADRTGDLKGTRSAMSDEPAAGRPRKSGRQAADRSGAAARLLLDVCKSRHFLGHGRADGGDLDCTRPVSCASRALCPGAGGYRGTGGRVRRPDLSGSTIRVSSKSSRPSSTCCLPAFSGLALLPAAPCSRCSWAKPCGSPMRAGAS